MAKVETKIRFLMIYSAATTLVCAALFGLIFQRLNTARFRELDVERINVIEPDGKLRLVLSNQVRQHPGIMDGVTYDERRGQRPPGLMFFNEKGDEAGGLVFDGGTGKGQGGSLTFDKFRGDQTIQLIHEEDEKENYFAGVKMNDQNMPLNDLVNKQKEISRLPTPEAREAAYRALRDQGLLMTERLRIGRDYDRSSVLKMKDARGKVRIEMKVEADGTPKLSFFDGLGRVTYRLPDDAAKATAKRK